MSANDPLSIRISDYQYDLPDERIAHFPLEKRDDSKLLIWKNNVISEDFYHSLHHHIPAGSKLVFNNTRVIPARLYFEKETGATIEIFLLEPVRTENYDLTQASATWNCLVGKAGKWKPGQQLRSTGKDVLLTATITGKTDKNFVIRFDWDQAALSFFDVIARVGNIPLPPYIKRKPEASDLERYQTVYAEHQGSVAAPTAGLHFTPELLEKLQEKDVRPEYLTLHVGAGTFLPVKSETMAGHQMHAEWMDISIEIIQALAGFTGDLFAVGTTSLRTLESLYWMGVKANKRPGIAAADLPVTQWEVYQTDADLTRQEAMLALANWMNKHSIHRLLTTTEILIAPPYRPKMIRGLVTNFHQPNSTLLLLIASITGDKWRAIYDYALSHNFRFLSYGDGCLLYLDEVL